eukprot:346292_1
MTTAWSGMQINHKIEHLLVQEYKMMIIFDDSIQFRRHMQKMKIQIGWIECQTLFDYFIPFSHIIDSLFINFCSSCNIIPSHISWLTLPAHLYAILITRS